MPVNTYDKGDGVRLWAEFKSNNIYTDPTAVYLYIQDPNEVEYNYIYTITGSVQKYSTGIYYYDLEIGSLSGTWYYKYEGTGLVNQTAEKQLVVRRSEFP